MHIGEVAELILLRVRDPEGARRRERRRARGKFAVEILHGERAGDCRHETRANLARFQLFPVHRREELMVADFIVATRAQPRERILRH